jgi:general secretion pathway protein B
MSYILDALKKSEQERGHGSVPGVQTIHSSSINYHNEKKSIWPLLLFALVFINITALAYFILTKQQSETVIAAQQQTYDDVIETPRNLITPDTVTEKPVHAVALIDAGQNSTPLQTSTSDEVITDLSVQETTRVEQVAGTMSLHDIPLNVRQHIPAMQFSAHVYSSNASIRSIIINGRFMEEGDLVTNDLILSEITSDGAIFEFQGYRFSANVLSGWDIN